MHAVPPASSLHALRQEFEALRPGLSSRVGPAQDEDRGTVELVRTAHQLEFSALCLSGGGIRSAAFSVGLLEGLARHGRLGTFDYLSTVSGGGYAGAWLSAWRLHAARSDKGTPPPPEPWPTSPPVGGGSVEPDPLRRLRVLRRYLAPHEGVASIDLWVVFATMARNLLLNWLALVPLLAGLLLLPYVYLALIQVLDRGLVDSAGFDLSAPATWILIASLAFLSAAVLEIARGLPGLGGRVASQRRFLGRCLAPLCVGILGLLLFWAVDEVPIRLGPAVGGATALSLSLWVVATVWTERRWRPRSWSAAALAGAFTGAGLWVLTTGAFGSGHALTRGYASFAFPLVLGIVLLATVLFVGFSRDETTDEDLEWWGRFGAWLLVVGLAWLTLATLVFWGPLALDWIAREVAGIRNLSSGRLTAMAGLLTMVVGGVVALGTRAPGSGSSGPGWLARRVTSLGIPVFAGLLLAFLALLNLKMLRTVSSGVLPVDLTVHALVAEMHLVESLVLAVLLAAFGVLVAGSLPVNRFSLNGMYRNRLVRSFVGASRPEATRSPSPFTGFDPADDVSLSELAPLGRPLHVLNATLNDVADHSLSMQERKAQPFTFSPLYCGSWKLGYRPAAAYAGGRTEGGGVSLGTAATVSGAAASPNMGSHSSPALTFLLTLFNARLGAWFGNPGAPGDGSWRDAEPRFGPFLLLRELAGATDERTPYVFLSDGGHFENLGLYEMVRRRCRLIVVSDASCDPQYLFGDLSIAIRTIRVDFSIPIDFPDGLPFDGSGSGRHFAVGRIGYAEADGPGAPPGVLVYLKATLTGDEPLDVVNYARSHPDFPHEPTGQQFYTEAQFESYRVLGRHAADSLFADGGPLALAREPQ